MRNVLSATFLRLKRSRILWLCLAYMLYDGLRLFYNASQMSGTRWAPSLLLLRNSSPEQYNFSPLTMLRYKLFAEWLPGGQALHCVDLGSFWAPEDMILHALIVIAAATAIGLALFQWKDLK